MSRKRPIIQYQFEPTEFDNYTEWGAERGARMEDIDNPDIVRLKEVFSRMDVNKAMGWLELNQKTFDAGTFIVDTADSEKIRNYAEFRPKLIFNRYSLNKVRHLNTLLKASNEALAPGGYLYCHARTAVLKKQIILCAFLPPFNYIIYGMHFFWHRACPKLPILRKIYFALTRGKNRTYNRVEVLGRFCRAGFDIVDECFLQGEFYVIGKKMREPVCDEAPNCGLVIKLRRVGRDGQLIGVYKLRTMYSYSEYLQGYMYKHGGLQEGGKFKDDYRVSNWGRILRKCWLDELPMLVNFFKGDLKLVGVRPLSLQYFGLYTPEMQELRVKVKPGLLPPFYYEKISPKTIEDVQTSERRYIEAYLEHPFGTDWKYFWGSVSNILFRKRRSG